MTTKKTLVLGASENPARYSNLAVKMLVSKQQPVVALGKKTGSVAGVTIETEKKNFTDIDTITLYLNPVHQKEYYDISFPCIPNASSLTPVPKMMNWLQWPQQKALLRRKPARWFY